MLLGDTKVTKYTGDYKAIVKYCTPRLVICFILSALFIIVPFLLFSWPKAIAFILIPYFLSSIIFINVTQVSHIQEEVQPETVNENWMRQMVEHSMDYSQDSKLWFFLTGGLNLQSIHHCIPALDSSQLFELYPKFREICKKHGVKINEVPTFLEAVKKYWYHMYNVSTNPTKIKQPPKGEGCPYKASKVD
jgi:fatty acid desaturase